MCKTLKEEIMVNNFVKYRAGLDKYLSEELSKSVIESLGGEESVTKATFSTMEDSGMAYDGALVENVLDTLKFALKLNGLLPEESRVPEDSIVRVVLLSQIAKVKMYEPNNDEYSRVKRGVLYSFREKDGALRTGEKSILIAMNAGVKFTENEFEAMRILDKDMSSDTFAKDFSSTLSVIVRQSFEMIINLRKKQK